MSELSPLNTDQSIVSVCILPVLPMRLKPSEQAEMTSQILYGEEVTIIEQTKKWSRIKSVFDNYEGWVDNIGIKPIDKPRVTMPHITQKLWSSIIVGNNRQLWIPAGSEIENESEPVSSTDNKNEIDSNILNTATQFLGIPYLWGGRSSFGIDCSGFIQTVFKINGIALPRDAKDQAAFGENIEFIDMIKPCDLLFFSEPKGNITHVGMAYNDGKIIHASGMVKTDLINHQGIFNQEMQKYTHSLRLIKRLI